MSDIKNRKVEVHLSFFKPSGKFSHDETYTATYETIVQCRDCDTHVVYMSTVFDDLRERARNRQLPCVNQGTWNGYIFVNCDNGYPGLIDLTK